jgi:hypothetical protein
MRIEGFTYVRNGLKMGYPFLPSINSVLPIVDQLFVVVGDSEDGSREAIENLKNDKIVIVDSIWEEEKRVNGEIFKDQANLGLQKVTGDWAIHIQADEVLNEADGEKLINYIHKADELKEVDGLLFPFYHFWGDYQHIRKTRRTHAFEIRAFKNNRNVQSYRDSQGFRIFKPESSENNGTKLKVLKTDIPIYHYAYTRHPKLMNKKSNYFDRFWHSNEWLKNNTKEADFDYNEVDRLEAYEGLHPIYMRDVIKQKDWEFNYDPSKSNMRYKDRILNGFERQFKHRLFEYKNYKLV